MTTRVEIADARGVLKGTIERLFPRERLVEARLEPADGRVVAKPAPATREAVEARREEARGGVPSVFVHVAVAWVMEKGESRRHDDRTPWFSKDAGWTFLKVGQLVEIEHAGTSEVPAPRALKETGRSGDHLTVYRATSVHVL